MVRRATPRGARLTLRRLALPRLTARPRLTLPRLAFPRLTLPRLALPRLTPPLPRRAARPAGTRPAAAATQALTALDVHDEASVRFDGIGGHSAGRGRGSSAGAEARQGHDGGEHRHDNGSHGSSPLPAAKDRVRQASKTTYKRGIEAEYDLPQCGVSGGRQASDNQIHKPIAGGTVQTTAMRLYVWNIKRISSLRRSLIQRVRRPSRLSRGR